jgi:hypothetical protein
MTIAFSAAELTAASHEGPDSLSTSAGPRAASVRAYAIALGIAFTVGYAYVGQLAVRSAGVTEVVGAVATNAAPAPLRSDTVWSGGTLAPVVVEGWSAGAAMGTAYTRNLDRGSDAVCAVRGGDEFCSTDLGQQSLQ